MSDTQTVQPALSEQEWADALERLRDEEQSIASIARRCEDFERAMIALYNHTLPDGHPGKVTRAMVEEIASAAFAAQTAHDAGVGHPADADILRSAAAALAALLPGEG